MIKNIFFDFDGVIVDSVNIKTEAFKAIYLPYGKEIADKVAKHHNENGGMSRFEKFKLYHQTFLDIDLDENDIQQLSKRFSDIVLKSVVEAPEIKGSHKFIKEYKNKLNMFVVTGTPTEESIQICKSRGIFNCFKEICGSPQKKGYWSRYLLEKHQLIKEETIFVGDAIVDYKAAKQNGLKFYLRISQQNINVFQKIPDFIPFSDFNEFKAIL